MDRGDGMGLNASAKKSGARWWGSSRAVESAELVEGLNAASRGDLSQSLDSHDGRGLIERFNAMCASLSGRVGQIRNNASIVAMAGESLADDVRHLDERTQEQARQLDQAWSQVQQLGDSMQTAAQRADSAHKVSSRVREAAESGAALMQEAVTQVRQIEASSREMSDVIAVIDSIAFQTNILALNAAVEAARAGEQGRGFAVVASEVRSLAQRSAESAAQVKRLIARSAEQVDLGVRGIETLGQTLSNIVDGVRDLSTDMGDMATASAGQAQSLNRIAQAVQGANDLTQRNAEMVAASARAARELHARTDELTAAAQRLRLRQGSADEARQMVERAVALIKRSGLAAAVPRLVDKSGEFFDRDMYIFIFDRSGIFTAFGPNPSFHGGHLRQVSGLQWEHLLRDGFACTDQGGGWVDYQTVRPGTGEVLEKVSFVRPLPGDLLIGCGVYKL
jgi:methyl-accepting chemotaxis protein